METQFILDPQIIFLIAALGFGLSLGALGFIIYLARHIGRVKQKVYILEKSMVYNLKETNKILNKTKEKLASSKQKPTKNPNSKQSKKYTPVGKPIKKRNDGN
jgi:hypothetical protein